MTAAITIATDLLAAVAKWASTDESRPGICCVAFRADNTIAATDGHRLVVVPHETHGLAFLLDRKITLAAIAAQNVQARDGIDPPLDHDLVTSLHGDTELTDGPYGNRTIDLTLDDKHVVISLGSLALRAAVTDVAFPPIDQIFKGVNKGTPDDYLLDARYLAAIVEVNNATAGYSKAVRVTHWGRRSKDGIRDAIIFEGATGVRFAIMPHIDKGVSS
jgi:hypothetical protein